MFFTEDQPCSPQMKKPAGRIFFALTGRFAEMLIENQGAYYASNC
jgi:hypothetical protein